MLNGYKPEIIFKTKLHETKARKKTV